MDLREVRAYPPGITGQEGQFRHQGMGANEKVGQRYRPCPTPLAIRHKGFAREEPRLPGHGQAPKLIKGEGCFDLLNACKAYRDFRVNHHINIQGDPLGPRGQCRRRPGAPGPVVRHNI